MILESGAIALMSSATVDTVIASRFSVELVSY